MMPCCSSCKMICDILCILIVTCFDFSLPIFVFGTTKTKNNYNKCSLMCGTSYLASQSYTRLICMMVILMSPGVRTGATCENAAVIFGTYLFCKRSLKLNLDHQPKCQRWGVSGIPSSIKKSGGSEVSGAGKMAKDMKRRQGKAGESKMVLRLTWHILAGLWKQRLKKELEFGKCFPDYIHGFELQAGFTLFSSRQVQLIKKSGRRPSTKSTINTKFLNLYILFTPTKILLFYILKFAFIKELEFSKYEFILYY